MRPWLLISYNLAALRAGQKQQFSHALSGTKKRPGLLAQWRAQKVGRLAFLVEKETEAEAIAFLNHYQVPYAYEVVWRVR
jgi:hypothetical protein